MKISATQYNRKVTIEDERGEDMDIQELLEEMIKPLLRGLEYSDNLIDKIYYEDNDKM